MAGTSHQGSYLESADSTEKKLIFVVVGSVGVPV